MRDEPASGDGRPMIFVDDPVDWKDLERRVAQVFEEIGCDTRRQETVQTVRGRVQIDVHVKDQSNHPVSAAGAGRFAAADPLQRSTAVIFRQPD